MVQKVHEALVQAFDKIAKEHGKKNFAELIDSWKQELIKGT